MYSDRVPAMLMGGEFVMKKSVVDKFGANYFDGLNNAGTKGYAYGGVVGNTYSPDKSYNNSDVSDYFSRLIDVSREIRDSLVNTKNNNQAASPNGEAKNNFEININISMSEGKTTAETTQTRDSNKSKDEEGSQDKRGTIGRETFQQISTMIKVQVMEVLGKESRPGGLLNQKYKTK